MTHDPFVPNVREGRIVIGLLTSLSRVALTAALAIGIAVPVVTYVYARHLVILGAQVSIPAVRLPVAERATYSKFTANTAPTFLVLEYSDLSAHDTSSSDQSSRTVGAVAFTEQLAMLKTAGFVSVTASQVGAYLSGGGALPVHAVLIGFDGGRERDWTLADGILDRYGYAAIVFVDPDRVAGRGSGYLSWTQLTSMVSSGRWSVGVDVSGSSASAVVDSKGNRGPALLEHKWLTASNRAETSAEYSGRIRDALEGEVATVTSHGLPRPMLLAYPFGSSYPLDRAPSVFDELAEVVNTTVSAGVLPMRPDTTVTGAYRSERLLPSLEVYARTTTMGLFSRIQASAS